MIQNLERNTFAVDGVGQTSLVARLRDRARKRLDDHMFRKYQPSVDDPFFLNVALARDELIERRTRHPTRHKLSFISGPAADELLLQYAVDAAKTPHKKDEDVALAVKIAYELHDLQKAKEVIFELGKPVAAFEALREILRDLEYTLKIAGELDAPVAILGLLVNDSLRNPRDAWKFEKASEYALELSNKCGCDSSKDAIRLEIYKLLYPLFDPSASKNNRPAVASKKMTETEALREAGKAMYDIGMHSKNDGEAVDAFLTAARQLAEERKATRRTYSHDSFDFDYEGNALRFGLRTIDRIIESAGIEKTDSAQHKKMWELAFMKLEFHKLSAELATARNYPGDANSHYDEATQLLKNLAAAAAWEGNKKLAEKLSAEADKMAGNKVKLHSRPFSFGGLFF
jgi:hypothetical protein